MGRTVAELLETTSTREIAEWRAFEEIYVEPIYQVGATICLTLCRLLGGKQQPRYEDFLPARRSRRSKRMSDREMKSRLGGFGVFTPAPSEQPNPFTAVWTPPPGE